MPFPALTLPLALWLSLSFFVLLPAVPGSMGVTTAKDYLDGNLAQGWSTAVTMLLICISIAAGLLAAQGLALAAASLGSWCCQHGTEAMRRHKQRERRQGPIQGGIDSVYF